MTNYQDIRNDIKSGDLLAFTHRSWKTWYDIKVQLVRFFTRSEYCHVGVAWVVSGRVFIIEAVMPYARIYPLSKSGDFYWIEMDATWLAATEELAISHIGSKYSQSGAVMALFRPLDNDQYNECAAYALQIYNAEGLFIGVKAIPSALVQAALELGKHLHLVNN